MDEKHISSIILDEDPTISTLVPILFPRRFNEDHELIHLHKVPGPVSMY